MNGHRQETADAASASHAAAEVRAPHDTWVGRHQMQPPASLEAWKGMLRERFRRRNRELGIDGPRAAEVLSVTAWGEVPEYESLLRDFPKVMPEASNLNRLKDRLARWRGEG